MSLFYDVLFASKCRSNHHRLALDALRWLEGADADRWRDLFLHHHVAYLEGAKAPDEVFKDFKNHVLHVRDNYWGGAVEAAEEWYRRTVRALREEDWKLAAYSAGVLSHYVVDPIQPFHTGQTEEEGVIHRAVEQSLSKAYANLQALLLSDLGGYPSIDLPEGEDWLAQTVRMGADASNPHYETLIDHYDFARGAKKPLEGLDDAINRAIAPLIGRAAITLARIYERAFAEAGVTAPRVILAVDTLIATLSVPINTLVNAIGDEKERALVRSMYAEFQKSGKVRDTLPEDDKEVRALHAAEVLNQPLSSLNAKWPREIGLAHAPVAKAAQKAKPAPAPKLKPAPTPQAKAEAPPRKPAPAPKPAIVAALDAAPVGATLHRDDPIVDAPSIGAKTAARLEAVGLRTVGDLLEAEPDHAAKSVKASHITPPVIRTWQAQAMLACAIPSLRSFDAQVLVGVDVRDVMTLSTQTAGRLANAIADYLKTTEGKQLGRGSKPADQATVARWIEAAQTALSGSRNAA